MKTARATAFLTFLFVGGAGAVHAQQFDPIYRFHTLNTQHFVIYFHQNEERLASRLASIAEDAWRKLERTLGAPPPGRTHVVLVDQTDLSNGWATPLPRDTIAIFAVWPAPSDMLRTDDWLTLVFTHEFTHIVHLDRSRGWTRPVRAIFGRVPVAFPNLFLPTWQIEGLATYEESRLTGEGRLHAGDFRAIVDEAARAGRLAPLDRVNGGLTRWPDGHAPYAYGLGFQAYLDEQYGPDKVPELADATARRLPYFGSTAFRTVYGKSLGTLWREYERRVTASTPAAERGVATRLTRHQYIVTGPRVAPACPGCGLEVFYSVRNADEFPSLYKIRMDSSEASVPRRVTSRYLGSTSGVGPGHVYFDQQEVRRNAGLYSDLYVLDRRTNGVSRLTRDARLIDPDLSPDGGSLIAVQIRPGERDLIRVRLRAAGEVAGIDPIVQEPDTQFNTPRWSPDGRFVAAARQRAFAQPEIVVIDVASGALKVIAAGDEWRWMTPTWRPDGQAVLAAGASGEGPFNLYEIDLATLRMRPLTRTTGGATWPEVSPDSHTIIYVRYTAEGFDLFRMPYPSGGSEASSISSSPRPFAASAAPTTTGASRKPYSPWSTLPPTWWSPVIDANSEQTVAGAETAGSDVLGYHNYYASVTWRVASPSEVEAPDRGQPDWDLSYAYTRWTPTVFASTSRSTSFFAGPPDESGLPSTLTRREQEFEVGVLLPTVHARVTRNLLASFVRASERFAGTGDVLPGNRSAVRGGWSLVSAHQFGNSISAEKGAAVGATVELVRRGLGASADATTFSADGRVYLAGLAPHHVAAIRVAAARTSGDRHLGRTFLLGGDAAGGLMDFDADALGLLRGFEPHSFAGTRVAVVNADYRWPIARIERGHGTWPIFLHTIHAALFVDAGHAWTRTVAARDWKSSGGAEIALDLIAGYAGRFSLAFGAARGHDGSNLRHDATRLYWRVGRAF
jgi:hypothetical protein